MVFKKIKFNPFLIIEKAISMFQNFHEFMNDIYLNNERHIVLRKVEKLIRWIPLINKILKLNFDDSRINYFSASSWVIRDSNRIIKLTGIRYLGNASIIITECVVLRDGVLTVIYNDFTNLEIERDSKVIIDSYNRISSSLRSIILFMKVI